MKPPRTCLSVPGSSQRMLEKALGLDADELVLDLEDAVAPSAKGEARAAVVELLAGSPNQASRIAVRVNAPGSPWCHLDRVALAGAAVPPSSVVVPKVDGPDDVFFTDRLIAGEQRRAGRPPSIGIQALIESPSGLAHADTIAGSSSHMIGLILGYADLGAALRRRPDGIDPQGADWDPARHIVLQAARQNGSGAIDGPYLGVNDDPSFRAAVERARALGFDGKWTIHPRQLSAIADTFRPREEEVIRARRVLDRLRAVERDQAGAATLDGAMLDEAVRRWAVDVLTEDAAHVLEAQRRHVDGR